MENVPSLKQQIQTGKLIVAPGAIDAITVRLIEKAGFSAAYVTGSGVSLSLLAHPDLNTVSYSEFRDRIFDMCAVVDIPLIVDIDTGFGGPLNLVRLVKDFERIGVGGVQIEDQLAPKRCGHELGRRVVPPEVMIKRIRTIYDTRTSDEFVIIARTDAVTSLGIDEAIRRANLYLDAGADVAFVESPETITDIKRIGTEVKGPRFFNAVEGGRSPFPSQEELSAFGFNIVIYPNALTRIMCKSAQKLLSALKKDGTTKAVWDDMLDHKELWGLFDHDEWVRLEKRYT